MTRIAMYMRLYYPDSNNKITWKCMLDKNKTLFQYEGHRIDTEMVHIPIFCNRLSCSVVFVALLMKKNSIKVIIC